MWSKQKYLEDNAVNFKGRIKKARVEVAFQTKMCYKLLCKKQNVLTEQKELRTMSKRIPQLLENFERVLSEYIEHLAIFGRQEDPLITLTENVDGSAKLRSSTSIKGSRVVSIGQLFDSQMNSLRSPRPTYHISGQLAFHPEDPDTSRVNCNICS